MSQLRILQAQLDDLRRVTVNEINVEPIGSQNKNTTIHPSVPIPESLSIESFIGLKLMHLVGIVVLVTGISIGVKYASFWQWIT